MEEQHSRCEIQNKVVLYDSSYTGKSSLGSLPHWHIPPFLLSPLNSPQCSHGAGAALPCFYYPLALSPLLSFQGDTASFKPIPELNKHIVQSTFGFPSLPNLIPTVIPIPTPTIHGFLPRAR